MVPVIFNIFLSISYIDSALVDASSKLLKCHLQLGAWSPESQTSKQHHRDAACVSAHHDVRVGLLQLVSYLYKAQGDMTLYDDLATPSDGRELVNRGSQALNSKTPSDTVWEPLLLWSLVVMCAASSTRFESRTNLLAGLCRGRSIDYFRWLTDFISTIAYHPKVLDSRCQSVWVLIQRCNGLEE